MAYHPARQSRFTFDMPLAQRAMLDKLAEARGISAGECLREILAEKFAQLQEEQA